MSTASYIRWFADIGAADVPLVGGKTASLGELHGALSGAGVTVPEGFAITAQAYRDALTEAGAWTPLHKLLDGLDKTDVALLDHRAAAAREIVYAATGGAGLIEQITEAYRALEAMCGASSPSPSAARRRRRTCRPPASPASTKASSTSAARRR